MNRDARQLWMIFRCTSDNSSRFERFFAGVLAAIFLVVAPSLRAQEAIGTVDTSGTLIQPSGTNPTTDQTTTPVNPAPNFHSTDLRSQVSSEPRRFQYNLQISVRGVYDDNIELSHTDRVSDWYFSIEPVLTLGVGDIAGHEDNFLRLDYFPAFFLFLSDSEHDAFQQVIHVQGQHRFGRLTLGLSEEVAILDGTDVRGLSDQTTPGSHPNLDVAGRTKFQTYRTRLDASYDLSGKTFLTSEINSLITNYNSSSLFSSGDVSANLFMNYHYSDKLVVGVGGTGGYNFVEDPNPNETFEQANMRLAYQASGKLTFAASGGVEFRQFE
ncbi:MAG: hypothetical protein DME57_01575 [Verrucomicrobia bacterium]|nr:MAG: hypothetical protein DME57_01575 [Verrucomicrobiota bacterium]